jgi:hypothetical protein
MRLEFRRTLLLAATALTIWSFGYGPLLPWSPARPGFDAIVGERVTVVYPEATILPEALRAPDKLLEEAEGFHRLRAGGHITIFLCPDWPTAFRVLPRLARRGIGAITLATGHTIYLLPTVAERGLDAVEFVRHELSHAVIHQNQGLLDATRIVEVQWLAEGLAVWFGRQKAYITDAEFLRLAPSKDLAAYVDPALRDRLSEPFDVRFGYVCWKHFNAFLERRDPERYWGYVHATIQEPRRWRFLFEHHFQQSFGSAINAFALQVQPEAASVPTASVAPVREPHRHPSR